MIGALEKDGAALGLATGRAAEYSEVLPPASVAVAVMNWPEIETGDVKVNGPVLPSAPVVTSAKPRNVCPSPLPEGSAASEAKNSTRNVADGRLLSVAEM